MTDYILEHHQRGERDRLTLMAELLDPMHRRWPERVGVGPGMRPLEVGCGNGSIAAWLGERTAPGGRCDDPSWWTQTIAFTAVCGRVTR